MDELTESFPQLTLEGQEVSPPAAPKKPTKKPKKKSKNKKKRPSNTEKAPIFYVFTEHHNLVVEKVGVGMNMRATLNKNAIQNYETNLTGKFECRNPDCKTKFWPSGLVTIIIQMYSLTDYSTRVYGQSCRACKQLGHLQLDVPVYVERVSYRLRKWLGFTDETPHFGRTKQTKPHESQLCEGCKAGFCKGKQEDLAYDLY